MTIYYSATTNAFYDSQVYNVNNIPEDKVAVAESTYKNLMAQQCAGRVIVAAADGTPTTIAQTCGPCTSTKYATKTELTNGLAAKANDSNVVHKTGDETINGVKSFGGMLKATNGTVQVGADTGYSVTFNYNGNITSKQARGTYNIFFPEGSGTLALTSDINGKANDSDVVHKTGDEIIEGIKTFTNVIISKNNAADLSVTPTSYHADHNYSFTDKNNVSMGHIEYCQRPTGVNDIGIIAWDKNGVAHGIHINTSNEVIPLMSSSESYSLGSSSAKWAKVYSDDVVHTSGDETIAGNKTFSNRVSFPSGYFIITDTNDNSLRIIRDGTNHGNNYKVIIQGDTGKIFAPNGFIGNLQGNADTATSANDPNAVHRSGDETIAGVKTFTQNVNIKNNNFDLTVTPTNNVFSTITFIDKNNTTTASLQNSQRTYGVNDLCFYVNDNSSKPHGFRIRTDKILEPIENNTYSLGSASNKWANVYSDEINTKYFTYTHDSVISYSYLPKVSGTLAIQERTRASAVVENRTLLYECVGGLDAGDITLNDVYSKFNALLIVYSNDDGGGISTYYLDCAELDIRREVAGGGSFLLIDGHSYWACTGASTGTKFVHTKNDGLRIHKIYGLAKYY